MLTLASSSKAVTLICWCKYSSCHLHPEVVCGLFLQVHRTYLIARFYLLSDNLSPAGTSIWLYKTKIEKVKHGLRWTSYRSSSVPSSPGMWFSLVESSVSEPLLLYFLPSGVGFTIITGQAQFCAQYSLTLPRKTLHRTGKVGVKP